MPEGREKERERRTERERYNLHHSSTEYRRIDVAVELGRDLKISVIVCAKLRFKMAPHRFQMGNYSCDFSVVT